MLQLPEAIARPTAKQLRQFAVVLPVAVVLIGWSLGGTGTDISVAALIAAGVALAGWCYPPLVKPAFVAVSVLAYPIGRVVSELVMLAVYFGLITPIALVFRWIGRDALERAIDGGVPSYWRAKKQPDSVSSYLRRW